MTRWSQFTALAVGQLGGRHSLRDIATTMAAQGPRLYHLGVKPVARSSLARVNAGEPYGFYEALFHALYGRCRQRAPGHGFRFKGALLSIDSTLVELSMKLFPWADYNGKKAAMKLHVGLDHGGLVPAFANVSASKVSDLAMVRERAFPPGSLVVFDRGYTDFAWYQALDRRGVYFVTRARHNAAFETLEERPLVRSEGLSFDRKVRMSGVKPTAIGLKPLRQVGYRDPETGRMYVFLSNAFHLSAKPIAALYKARWQIELFFKWLKQNLKIKAFVGTSRNAVLTQIWVAMCVALLLAYLKFVARSGHSLQQILRLLQVNLFTRRNLAALILGEARDPVPKWQQNQLVLI